MDSAEKPIIIIDGNLYLYTSYYGFGSFKNIEGKPYGVIYGMLRIVKNLLNKYQNSKKMIIIFDSYEKTFRKKIFKEYKIHRTGMPNSLYIQIAPLLKILQTIGIKTLRIPGIEADDIIGSLAHKLEKEGEKILIVSHDKDMLQLATKKINIFNKNTKSIITPQTIKKKYGIQPKEYIDLLALIGDTADNIPGVPKIGIKSALFLLKNFSNIKNIYYNIEKISCLPFRNAKNIAIQLKKHQKSAFLSYQLAKIQLNVPIEITSKDIYLKKSYNKNLFIFFKNFYLNKKDPRFIY